MISSAKWKVAICSIKAIDCAEKENPHCHSSENVTMQIYNFYKDYKFKSFFSKSQPPTTKPIYKKSI